MPDDIEVSTVIGHIYEASYNPSFWPSALESIAKFTHSSSAALIYQDNEIEQVSDPYAYNISEAIIAKHRSLGVDPNFQIMSENVPLGKAAAIDHIIQDRKQLEYIYGKKFNKLMVEANMHYIGGALLFMGENRTAAIGIHRMKSMGGWTIPQIDKLNILIPHLQRAIDIQKEFTRLYASDQALHKGLDKMIMGLIIFDKELRPIYINPVAISIIKYHPAINLKNDKIYTHSKKQTKKIHKALISAVSHEPGTDNISRLSVSIGIKHPDYSSPLPVIISHAHRLLDGFESEGHHAYAVMCFSDPDKTLPLVVDEVAGVYGLTPAETQVAISIANGVSPGDIASSNDVAISTVRSQLKAVYSKVGVNSQAELTKVLLSGPFVKNI